jgi:hypothetical protein
LLRTQHGLHIGPCKSALEGSAALLMCIILTWVRLRHRQTTSTQLDAWSNI